MAKDAGVTDIVLTGGMNEGVERSVLQLPELALAQNMRQRKTGRWGKRFGSAALPQVNRTGTTLGNGLGNCRTIGPGLVVVDDQCALYDSGSAAWVDPRALSPQNSASLSFQETSRVPGVISGWLPDVAFFPVPPKAIQRNQYQACAQAYFLNLLWTCIEFADPITPADHMFRVVATDANQTVVFLQDIRAAVAGDGGVRYPKLVSAGSTLVLVFLSRPNNVAAAAILGRRLTTLAGQFGASATIYGGVTAATTFDVAARSSTEFAIAASIAVNTIGVGFVNAASLGLTSSASFGTALTTVTHVSIAYTNGGPVFVPYAENGGGNATRVRVFTSTLGATVGTATLSTSTSTPVYAALLPTGSARCVYGQGLSYGTMNELSLLMQDVTAAAVASGQEMRQWRMAYISKPFVIGTQCYIWCSNTDISNLGYAHLIRLPAVSEVPGTFSSTQAVVSCPVEMSTQDYLVAASPVIDQKGVSGAVQVGSSATYATCFPIYPAGADTSLQTGYDFRVVQAKHYTDSAANRSVNTLTADNGNQFIPSGALSRIDGRSCVESGFFLPPTQRVASKAGGGLLTASSTYLYTAIYRVQNANGRVELSAPSSVTQAALGVGETQVTLDIATLEVGAREAVQLEIYRTLSNGSVFYLLTTQEGGFNIAGNGATGYVDGAADTAIAANKVLYTQVGQQLPNGPPPPCRFGVVGGQRVWLGGLLRGSIAHCSKLLLGDQSPTWCDNDAFRVNFPAPLTGLAWMDNLVGFTNEGIYIVSGDGPDDSGVGEFSPSTRMPYELACIEPRSVITIDDGTWFQTSRGLYLLPRGFGAPMPAGDVVLETLTTYPIITGCVAATKAREQTVRWTCVADAAASSGAVIVYDIVHKAWSVDYFTSNSIAVSPHVSCSRWYSGEVAMLEPTVASGTNRLKSTNSTFADSGSAYTMLWRTGDVRLFGPQQHGDLQRLCVMGEVRSACTLNIQRSSDQTLTTPTASRVFDGVSPAPGVIAYTEVDMGSALKDITAAVIQGSETSTAEGLAFVGLSVEHQQTNGLRTNGTQERVV